MATEEANYSQLRSLSLPKGKTIDNKSPNKRETVMTAYTYILQCANGKYYVGSTTNLEARLNEHQAGLGGKYTSTHLPVKLVYFEEYSSIHLAFSRERQLHGWSRAKKEALIRGDYEALRPLASAGSATKEKRNE